jgi:hypothetical protein
MKTYCLFPLIIFFNISLSEGSLTLREKDTISDSIVAKAKRLNELYTLSTGSSSKTQIYRKQFFDLFPNSFKELNDLYGYNNGVEAPLYNQVEKHIFELFNNLNNINDTLYYKKIVSIAIGGHWDADAVNAFQEGLRKRVLSKPDLIVYLLKEIPVKKIKSFWYFYFDGVHPSKQIAEPLLKIKRNNLNIYNLMVEAHEEVIKKTI